ncbi:hypothetical protein [Flammeovirga sp. SJP92]|uniref:hypothetical protein n=1 Tax=Flammeovirga sp. SJP92 TaxID=1775430 RepID=UPI000788758D|nr:hypothetical protein [Flammeovirga sp. SJP92]KXX66512.1 hypothetical protein AVL50_31795 [Flammeovirga sp. SJP92]
MKFKQRPHRLLPANTQIRLTGIITLLAILIGILLFLSNSIQREQVLISYCGNFGFYGKSLTLMKQGIFHFSYQGCSQSNGTIKGTWKKENDVFTFYHKQENIPINTQYHQVDNLIISEQDTFILCEDYVSPWLRDLAED